MTEQGGSVVVEGTREWRVREPGEDLSLPREESRKEGISEERTVGLRVEEEWKSLEVCSGKGVTGGRLGRRSGTEA